MTGKASVRMLCSVSIPVLAFLATPAQAQSVSTSGDVVPTQSPNPSPNWDVVGNIIVGDTGDGELIVEDGGKVTTSNQGVIGYFAGSAGTVTVTGPDSAWTLQSALQVGRDGVGELIIKDGGTVESVYGYLGSETGSQGTVRVSNGGSWHNTELSIGASGTGELLIDSGGQVRTTPSSSFVIIGQYSGSTGLVSVSGSGSLWEIEGSIRVGSIGDGELIIKDSGTVESGYSTIGNVTDGEGTVRVSNGGSWNNTRLFIGVDGTGELLIDSGGQVRTTGDISDAYIGSLFSGTGLVSVSGSGSLWEIGDTAFIGNNGDGTLTISDGGAVESVSSIIGNTTDGEGAVRVSNGGSWNNTQLFIGASGTGELLIDSGGQVRTVGGGSPPTDSYAIIGRHGDSTGLVSVSGSGSLWEIGGGIYVGDTGTGELIIKDGGTVESGFGRIGEETGSEGMVRVSNGGSWNNTQLSIGTFGTGELLIDSGGQVRTTGDDADVVIGAVSDSGLVSVSGSGSLWEIGGAALIGASGDGTLTISDGGMVRSESIEISGDVSGASGVVHLNGTTSGRGVLETGVIEAFGGGALFEAQLVFDGGILRAMRDEADFLRNFEPGQINIDSGGAFIDSQSFNIGIGAELQGGVGLTKTGGGTLTLTGTNSYTGGTTISAGTLQLGNGGVTGSITGDVVNDGRLVINRSVELNFGGVISGSGTVELAGSNGVVLTGDNSYTGGTVIDGGILRLGNGGTTGSIVGDVLNKIGIWFNRSDSVTFGGTISGPGFVRQRSSGTTILTGNNDYTGDTNVNSGTLIINGDQSLATGLTTVDFGATLGGSGIIGGDVRVYDNGTLAPGNSPGTLTINGDLELFSGSVLDFEFGEADVVGGPLNDLIEVGGDLLLDGTINVTESAGGSFDVGVYRVFNYDGALTDNGLVLGTMPDGSDVVVQTSVAGQVNLVNSAGLSLNYWDGDAGPKSNGIVDGGNGIWQVSTGNDNWTDADGADNAGYADGAFAIFAGTGGTVTVDNGAGAVSASGMQFASDGYIVTGEDIALVGPESTIRVGDGTPVGGSFTSEIASNLTGDSDLVKTDLGTLVLSGTNSYTGDTLIDEGTLQLGNGGTSGSIAGDVTNNGILALNRSNDVTFGGVISGDGNVNQNGTGTTTLTGINNYTGDTVVNAGELRLAEGGQITGTNLLYIAHDAGQTASVTVDGVGSRVNAGTPQGVQIGFSGNGTLNVINGGAVETPSLEVGAFTHGTLNVVGAGSSLITSTSDAVVLGFSGTGVVNIRDGGYVQNAEDVFIAVTDGQGIVTVSGENSRWEIGNQLGLRRGSLSVSDGGVVNANDIVISRSVFDSLTYDGQITVSGAGSALTSATNFVIGDGETSIGALTIADGGAVTVGGGTLALGEGDAALNIGGAQGEAATGAGVLNADTVTMAAATSRVNFNHTDTAYEFDAELSGAGAVNQTGSGTTILTGINSYNGGTTISAGTLQLGNDGPTGSITGDVVNDGRLVISRSVELNFGGVISGSGTVELAGSNGVVLTGDNSYTGGTVIEGGILMLGNGGTTGSIVGDVLNNTGIWFNRSDSVTFGGTISGTGFVRQRSAGTTILTGSNDYTGGTNVDSGTLIINGDQSGATGLTRVRGGATLGGAGTIGGDVWVDNGKLAPGNSPGTLTINGNLELSDGSVLDFEFGEADVVGGPLNDLIEVGGDLTLDGTINVAESAGGSFDAGIYRVINYGGALTDNGLALGTMPAGSDVEVQTSVTGSVNLVNFAGLNLNFWDGDAGPKFDGTVGGGDGIWQNSTGNDNWTDSAGAFNAGYTDEAFAIFAGIGGTVTVDNSAGAVSASGMQFANDGYVVNGDTINLVGPEATIRVGDGTASGGEFTATIDAELSGAARLVKTDAGTLILTGTNSYTGGTTITEGTLSISNDGNLGDAAGALAINEGVLQTTANLTSDRAITLNGAGTVLTDPGASFTATGVIDGVGSLTKKGVDTLILTGANSYTGGTTIAEGTLQLGNGGASGSIVGDVVNDAELAFNRSDAVIFDGAISGSGAVVQVGGGTLTLTADNSYAGATDVNAGTLLVNGDQSGATGLTSVASGATLGGSGIIGGDVSILDGGTLAPGNSPGTLTINGDLALVDGSVLDFEFGEAGVAGGPLNDLVNVGGDLTLDGTINVSESAGGNFGPGIYRMFNYDGTLTDNGLALGAMPADSQLAVQTAIDGQVNIVNNTLLAVNFWDGAAGPKNNDTVNGGDGVWRVGDGSNNWADMNGAINVDYAQDSFAIFSAAAGTVTVDNSGGDVLTSGMQFASDGYVITGGPLTLTGDQAIIRVGDSSAASAGYTAAIDAELTGAARLVKTDAGTLTLSGANSYTGGTAINGGTLQIASDANLGDAAGGLRFGGGTLQNSAAFTSDRAITLVAGGGTFRTDDALTLTGVISGAGALTKIGGNALTLTGDNSYTGATNVNAGTLLVNGDQSGVTGLTSVASGAALGGAGIIGGDVSILDGGTLAPGNSPGTLTINGDLALVDGSLLDFEFGEAGVAGGALNDLVTVGGDLTLDGTIDVSVSDGGEFGAGVYRVFDYGGTLTDNGLALGIMPGEGDVAVQTSVDGQVNLVKTVGLTLNFWDGGAGPKDDGVINGGDGVWQSSGGNDNWTDADGTANAAYADGSFAIFSGTGGGVTVDNSLDAVTTGGMQFAVDGYTIGGDAITLVEEEAVIRVGDGSNAGAEFTATINAELSGDSQLVKTDAGTLILGGTNSYAGGTAINGGTISIASDANLGDVTGAVTMNGGTLATTTDLASARDIILDGSGTFLTAADTTFTFDGELSGSGAFDKQGAGALLLTGDNGGYTGDGAVAAGTLAVDGILGSAVTVDNGARLEGNGQVGSITNFGVVAAGRDGFGTLTVAGSYAGNNGVLEIETVLGGDDSATDQLVVAGGTSGSTELVVLNRGGLGGQAAEGIKVIDVTGGASDGDFALRGDYVFNGSMTLIAGAYGYQLHQGGVSTPADGDWYLRTASSRGANGVQSPLYQPGVPLYENYGQTLQTLNTLPTLQERVGNRRWAQSESGANSGIWGRMDSTRYRPDARVSTAGADANIDSWKLQMGIDRTLSESGGNMLVAGVTGHYGEANAVVRSRFGDGTIKAKGYGAGATLTWYGHDGFYADAQAQFAWFDGQLRSSVLGMLVDDNDGTGQAFGLEVGKRSAVGKGLTLTPQIQMTYQNSEFDTFTDPSEAAVSTRRGDSLKTRWGMAFDHRQEWETGGTNRRSHIYGLLNLSYEWLDGAQAEVSGTAIENINNRLWSELAVGGSLGLNDRLTIYSQVSASTSVRDFGSDYSYKGVAGVRIAF